MSVFETAREREALTGAWGDFATVAGVRLAGQYNEPSADDLFVEGQAPTFLASLSELNRGNVGIGTTIDRVDTFDGRARGPFLVTRWQTSEDGAFITVALQQVAQ